MIAILLSAFLYIKPIDARIEFKKISERFDLKGKKI